MEKNASTRSNNPVHLGDDRLQTFINPLNRQEQADSGSVEIISVGPFSPYKSHLSREFSEESGFDQFSDSEDEVDDTADSLESYNRKLKVPKVSIHRRSRVVKL
ncbi:hypothetical protein HanXRQr2_Chr17g0816011 [Helianthus annuus]|uniref:Uncharacterized protein n=1 Tax=Helianthus annuus TaxID=4232 RepID=A0A9K3GW66_HELAN|nr:hypothetical protein HanXRQr2_Chr17g0816011 [Helianthus annuus]KAJ0430050.1 hypothetical protein HanHA300_Chr17g0664481 [Helianthus annuus]KAJ0808105.1 hypothetical protein HanLR1_Chr00c0760g0770711 [Helianthus annuus]